MSDAHAIALGIVIALLLLSAVGLMQLLLRPFDIAAGIAISAGDAIMRAKERDRVCRRQYEAELRRLKND